MTVFRKSKKDLAIENRKIFIDSSILIDFLRKHNKENSRLWELKHEYGNLSISAISAFGLYASATSTQKLNDVKTLLKWFDIIDFNEDIAEEAGRKYSILKQLNKRIDYRDLFIGSSALFYDMNLATLNIDHFNRIPDLKLLIP
ncbi:type II toxin-antitoxin system VapC family toxin [candidate division KSB1 bacterium]|nr:type II toxin-antitoxin system VapC family toxin [candidate division KSB1 bacterium]